MKLIIGIIIGFILVTSTSYALRVSKPARITEFNQSGLVALNETLEQLWDITNGRYNLTTVTTNPDGATSGKGGDMILYNASGTYYLAINVSGSKVWRSILLQDTP